VFGRFTNIYVDTYEYGNNIGLIKNDYLQISITISMSYKYTL